MNKERQFRQRWWNASEVDIHRAVFAMCREMETDQGTRRMDNAIYRALYGAKGYAVSIHGDDAPTVGTAAVEGFLTTNIIRTAVDVLGAKVGRGKPKASFVTNGGDWAAQRRARRLDDYVYGAMHAADFYRSAREVFRDAAVTDLGVVKGWVEDGRIKLERVDPDSIKVDTADGYDGKPRTLVQTSVKSRDWVHAMVESWHADKSEEARAAMHAAVDRAAVSADARKAHGRVAAFGDVVEVVEAWHLPSRPPDAAGKHDGRHVCAVSTLTLLDEPATFFPFAFCKVYPPFQGFYGQGVAELLIGNQRTLNWVLKRISNTIQQLSIPRLFFESSSKITIEQIAGGEDAMFIRGGRPPTVLTGNNVPPELWTLMEAAIRRGLEQVGVSEGAAAALKPAGITSGQGLRDFQDIQSERFSLIHLAFEDFVTDAARLVVRLSADAKARGEKIIAFVPRGRRSQPISWNDVAADEDSFTLKMFSTSSLPVTPAARKQYVEELWASGQIDSAEYRRLLDMPDTQASTDLALAARDAVDAVLERILDGDDDEGADEAYSPPEPFDDLAYAVKRGTIIYHWARVQGAPEARLAYVRRYIIQAQAMMANAQAGAVNNMRSPDAAQPSPAPAQPGASAPMQ